MAIAEVILRVKDESSKSITALTATSEGYDATLKRVADSVAKEEAAERSRAAALGLTVSQMRQVDDALKNQLANEKAAADAAQKAAEANKQFAATAQQRNMPQIPGEVIGAIDDATDAVGDLEKANWQAVQGGQSLKKNLGDIAQSLMAGMSPMQVLTQQGGALAEALTAGGSATAVLKSAFGSLIPVATLLAGTATILTGAFIAVTGVIDDYTAATDRAKHAQDSLKEAMKPMDEALEDARKEQQLLNDALESGDPKKYLEIADISAGVDRKEAEATAALREEQQALLQQLVDNRFEASKDGILAKQRVRQIDEELAAIHQKANDLAQLEVRNKTIRASIEGLSDADNKASKSSRSVTEAMRERAGWLDQMKKGIEAFQASQSFLYEQANSDNPIAQETERYRLLVEQINAAAVATGDLTLAGNALHAAEKQHLHLLAQAMAPTDSDTGASQVYDQGLGVAGQVIVPSPASKPTMTFEQGLGAATSLTELVKVDPTGIASGILAGMQAVGSLSSGAAGIQSAKDAVKTAKDELAQAQASGDAEEIKKATDGLKQAMDSLDGTLKAFNQTNALGQLQNLIDGVASGLPALGMAVSGMISGIIGDSIPALIGGIGDALMTIPEDLMGGILDGVPKLIEAMVKDAPKFMLELATLAPRIGFELIKELVKPDFWIGIADALVQGIGDGLTELWTTLLGFLGIDTSKQSKAGAFDRGGFFMEGGSADKAFGGTNEKGYKAGAFEKGGFFDRLFTGNTLPAYDVGSDFIAKSGLAVVHEGETVVPRHGATQAAAQDRMGNGRGNNYYLSGVIAANTEELVRHLREAERMGVSIG